MKAPRLILSGIVFFIFAGWALSFVCCAENDALSEANQNYRAGKYEEAAKIYENLAAKQPSAGLYYNLGNAYFREGKTGLAILNYERARRLAPRDRDVLINLNHVKKSIEFEIKDKRPWFIRLFSRAIDHYRLEECWFFGLMVYLLLMLWLLARTALKKRPLWNISCVVLLSFTVLSFVPVIGKYTLFGMRNQAVVTASNSEVRYGPARSDRVAFRLVEGLIVQIVDEREDWHRIELLDSQSGWALKSEITAV